MAERGSPARLLAWEGCLNARDLGGYPTRDGRETRWGAVVRSDHLAPLTATGQAALVAYGVRTIVDLRRPMETTQHPNPFAAAGSHGVGYVNVPFEFPELEVPGEPESLAAHYRWMLDVYQAGVVGIMDAIAGAPEGGVLIHCMAGKDRTGLISAFLLELAGVDRETIGTDYALTAECLRPAEEDYLENGPGERADRERELTKYMARAENMAEILAFLDERYGGVEAYLLRVGVSPDNVARLRQRLLPAEARPRTE